MSSDAWGRALIATTALHAGFQLTVSAVVYPALTAVPPADWTAAHRRHSKRVTPVVVLVYGAAAVTGAGAVITAPRPLRLLAATATAATFALTAFSAAPLHGRLAAGADPELLRRLVITDRWRTLGAVAAAVAAAVSR